MHAVAETLETQPFIGENTLKIPWAKLYMDEAEIERVLEVLKSNWVSMGKRVKEFEAHMARHVEVQHAVAVNSGTAALDTALKCIGIQPGDEVIIPALAYIATANSVLYQHATPVFADIDPKNSNIDANDVKAKITPRTKCIIAIDYGGHAADFDELEQIGKNHRIALVEDGAPGLGGTYRGRQNCSHGDIAITSFHTAKIFTTVEGGMLFTDNDDFAETARIIRSQGEDPGEKYAHPLVGHNYRMTEINAAIGLAQMNRAQEVLAARKAAADYYLSRLENHADIKLPRVESQVGHAWFLFPIQIKNRDAVKQRLTEHGIETNVSWPHPIYDQKPFSKYKQGVCAVSERAASRILCLPMFFGISKKEQDYVIEHLLAAIERA